MRSIVVLGSTGSIGTQALDVIGRNRDRFAVRALGAGGANPRLLAGQAARFGAEVVGVADPAAAAAVDKALREARPARMPEIVAGPRAMTVLAGQAQADVVLNGMTGSIGLRPTLAALKSGAQLALANKESLVAGGALVADALARPGQIVPVDSEHSAIAQALASGRHRKGLTSPVVDGTSEVRRLILTASGGPFRGRTRADLEGVTPEQALKHPTWSMGPVVTVNSSTLVNKALELIEAAYLFDVDPQDIVPVVHPQSVVHSMVEFQDGSTIAQASPPDMRLPISLGLSWPDRLADVAAPNSWDGRIAWTFEPLDSATFPAVDLARRAVAASPLHPAVFNAANEECVEAFLNRRLGYPAIVETVAKVVAAFDAPSTFDVDAVVGVETWARARAHELMGV